MTNKCPYCKECLESLGHVDNVIHYYCILCGRVFKLLVGSKLEDVGEIKEFIK